MIDTEDLMKIDYDRIPMPIMEGLRNYVVKHRPVGHFLRSVIQNNLNEAVANADAKSFYALRSITSWLYWEAPSSCWGSEAAYEAWISSVEEVGVAAARV